VEYHIETGNQERNYSNVDLQATAIFQFSIPWGKAVQKPFKKREDNKNVEVFRLYNSEYEGIYLVFLTHSCLRYL